MAWLETQIFLDRIDKKMQALGIEGHTEEFWQDCCIDTEIIGIFRRAVDSEGVNIYLRDGSYFGNIRASYEQMIELICPDDWKTATL